MRETSPLSSWMRLDEDCGGTVNLELLFPVLQDFDLQTTALEELGVLEASRGAVEHAFSHALMGDQGR